MSMSMMVIYSANVIIIIQYDRRRSRLSNAPIDLEYDNNRDHRAPAQPLKMHQYSDQKSIVNSQYNS